MIIYRLDFAKKYLEDATELFNKKRFNSSASRAYYASYQAMWAALGDPEEGKMETSCNNKTFCEGLLVCTELSKNWARSIGR